MESVPGAITRATRTTIQMERRQARNVQLAFFMSWKLRHATIARIKPYNLVATEGKLMFIQRHVTTKFVRFGSLLSLWLWRI